MFLTCAAAVAAALEPAGRQEGPVVPVRQVAYLKASNSDAFDHFACGGSLPGHIGNALAVSGDGNTIAVGAPHESSATRAINGNQDDNSLYNSGAVYVYVRRGDAWTQQAYLKASNAGQSDQFGLSLSLSRDGNSLAVAAPWEASAATGVNGNQQDDSIPQAGAVYVFARRKHLVATLLHQGVEHRPQGRGRRHRGQPVRLLDFIEWRRRHAGGGAVEKTATPPASMASRPMIPRLAPALSTCSRRRVNTWAQQAYLKSGNNEAGDLFGYGVSLSAMETRSRWPVTTRKVPATA